MATWPTDAEIRDYINGIGTTLTVTQVSTLVNGLSDSLADDAKKYLGVNMLLATGSFSDVQLSPPSKIAFSGQATEPNGTLLDFGLNPAQSVVSIKQIDLDGTTVLQTFDTTAWKVAPSDRLPVTGVWLFIVLIAQRGSIRVNADWGRFPDDDVPANVVRAVKKHAAAIVYYEAAKPDNATGLKSFTSGPFGESYDPKMSLDAKEASEAAFHSTLDQYKRVAF